MAIARRSVVILVAACAAVWPSTAFANVGLPMVAVYLPPAWTLLVPIILLEAGLGAWRWRVSFRSALAAQALANSFSTVVGLPIAWLLLAVVELRCCGTALGLQTPLQRVYAVTVQAPWLVPYEQDFWWMIPAAVGALTVPFYAMSVACEYMVVKRMLRTVTPRELWHWVVRANVASYALLLVAALAAIHRPGALKWFYSLFTPVVEGLAELAFRIAGIVLGKS